SPVPGAGRPRGPCSSSSCRRQWGRGAPQDAPGVGPRMAQRRPARMLGPRETDGYATPSPRHSRRKLMVSKDTAAVYDAAIVGGGPGGSTVGALLKKYAPGMRVVILEREKFPRAHIGESQLPAICSILHEMGVWDKVEAAGFPIKLGASLTWGRD